MLKKVKFRMRWSKESQKKALLGYNFRTERVSPSIKCNAGHRLRMPRQSPDQRSCLYVPDLHENKIDKLDLALGDKAHKKKPTLIIVSFDELAIIP